MEWKKNFQELYLENVALGCRLSRQENITRALKEENLALKKKENEEEEQVTEQIASEGKFQEFYLEMLCSSCY